jgi:hypothetical protein
MAAIASRRNQNQSHYLIYMKSICSLGYVGILALAAWTTASSAFGALLTAVPMQGGMVMPMLSYHSTEGKLHVQVDPAVPELVPLLISNPGDRFDPADPWFRALDPSAGGLAFSRRYGFVMGTTTDPLPAGSGIWIRKLGGSADIGLYRYRNSEPKSWEPIFGTAGSADGLLWNGMMFHPGAAAPPGTNTYEATFEAYLVTTATGEPLPGTSTGPFTLRWTSVPDGRPALEIAQKVVISWPGSSPGWVLEASDKADASVWAPVTNTVVNVEGNSSIILDATAAPSFFRMRKAP